MTSSQRFSGPGSDAQGKNNQRGSEMPTQAWLYNASDFALFQLPFCEEYSRDNEEESIHARFHIPYNRFGRREGSIF